MRLDLEPLACEHVHDETSLALFLDRLEEQLKRVDAAHSQLAFTQYQTRQRPEGMDEVEAVRASLMTNPDYQRVVSQWVGRVDEPMLGRRLVLWEKSFSQARVSSRPEIRRLVNEISDTIVQFKYQVQGDTLDLGGVRNVLRTEVNRARRQAAWLSFAPLSRQLEAKTRLLFKLRNEAAQAEGYRTYVEMQLQSQGLTLEQVKAILEELVVASDPAYKRLMAEGAARHHLDQVQPWDVKFLLDGEGSLPIRYFPRAGIIPRLEEWGRDHDAVLSDLGISIHFMDIPYNGLSMTMNERDIRILANPADGHNYYQTAFHELGHCLHSAYNNPGSYILRREPSIFSESMAEMMGYLVDDADWLRHHGLSEEDVAAAGTVAMGPWFAYIRQRSAYALFEYEAYANPDGDLDTLFAATEARVLGCAFDPSPRWAAEPNAWYSRYPVYWQNYVLADVVASQIHHDLKHRFGSFWRNQEAIAYVRQQYWAPGASIDWQEKLERGTGERLNTRALVADLSGGTAD
ncbi:MAG: M3 family metallopeptidase [Mycobacterium leprae]